MILKRIASNSDGVFGVLIHENRPFALTLERPWLDNVKSLSCIPAGQYRCERVDSPHFGNTFEVTNVPDRTHILFHKGNIEDDTHGCILVGEQFEPLNGKDAILSSKKGFEEFLSKMKGIDSFPLTIEGPQVLVSHPISYEEGGD